MFVIGKSFPLFLAFTFLLTVHSFSSKSPSTTTMKRVLVTGANKGIGKAICQLLLEKHPDVCVLLGSRDFGRGEQAVQDLRAAVGDSACDGRLEVVELDTTSPESIDKAAAKVGAPLYGIINNAGIGFGNSVQDTVETNYFGTRRVNDAFGPFLQKPGGRIVNVASASGPNFLSSCNDQVLLKKLAEPMTITGGVAELDEIATNTKTVDDSQAYGFSKALVNAYTAIHAKDEPDLIINSCTPGYILTDLTAGMGATNPPSKEQCRQFTFACRRISRRNPLVVTMEATVFEVPLIATVIQEIQNTKVLKRWVVAASEERDVAREAKEVATIDNIIRSRITINEHAYQYIY